MKQTPSDIPTYTAANRAAWDASAAHHRASADWNALEAGFATPRFTTFDAPLKSTLQDMDVVGVRCVQIGCNNGREALSLANMRAKFVLGIDQSAAFLAQAEILSAINRRATPEAVRPAFLRADIYALPEDAPQDFDLALITIGVLNWMPDLDGFFAAVAGLLAPDGRLVIYETHPFLEMFDPHGATPLMPVLSYFRRAPYREQATITYDGAALEQPAADAPASYWFPHPLGDIVTACVKAGLGLRSLREFSHTNREVDYDIYVDQPAQLPMCYLLSAQK